MKLDYFEYFEQATKDLKKRSDVQSKVFTNNWRVTEERYEVTFEHANEVAELSLRIKYDENGGYEEVWHSGYEKQIRKASNVNDAVENAKYLIEDWKALKDNGAIPDVDHTSEDYEWFSIIKYPEKVGEIIVVSDVRHTMTVRRKDGTYVTRTVTVRGIDDLFEGLTYDIYSRMEIFLD